MERGSDDQEGFAPRGFFSGSSAASSRRPKPWLAARPEDIDVVLVAPKSTPRHIVAAFDASN
jgi:hypothetical protein